MSVYKTLLFDVDGTLLDFDKAERSALFKVLSDCGVAGTDELHERYSRINGALWKQIEKGEITRADIFAARFARFFDEIGLTADSAAAEARYRAALSCSHELIDGAKELLCRLHGRFDLYVVTNGLSQTQHARLAASGLNRFFTAVFVSEDAGAPKPDPAFFDYCFAHMGAFETKETLLIGDTLSSDILGAANAGLDACWYNPACRPNAQGIPVRYEIRALRELCGILGV